MVATVTALARPIEPPTPITPYAVQDGATVRVVCPRNREWDRFYYLTPIEAIILSKDLQAAAIGALTFKG